MPSNLSVDIVMLISKFICNSEDIEQQKQYLKKKKNHAGGMAQLVNCLQYKYRNLSSNP